MNGQGNLRFEALMTPDQRLLRAGIWDVGQDVQRRAICVLLQGLTEFIEKYAEVAAELNARGFAVATTDWRGQGASERLARDNHAAHVRNFSEYDHDLATLLRQVVEPLQPRGARLPVFALAHSMGGHILLRFLHDHGGRFACAVCVAPMLDVVTQPYPPWITKTVSFLFNLRRPSQRFVFGVSDRDPLTLPFEKNQVTSDTGRFERTRGLLKAQPFLRIFGPTFGWLGAAMKSMARMRSRRYAQEIEAPLLVIGAGNDNVVPTAAIRDFVKLLPKARYVEIAGARHEILMETDAIRAQFWRAFDEFVAANLRN